MRRRATYLIEHPKREMTIPKTMRAMVLDRQKAALKLQEVPVPEIAPGQVLLKVKACGVCRTDLHIVDGDLKEPKLSLIPGHEIVGEVVDVAEDVNKFEVGERVGVPWLGSTCGNCKYCKREMENLCENALITGYTIDGGYAEYTVADHRYCFPISDNFSNTDAAPLLCAGLIGFRSYRFAGENAQQIGLYGFGAAAHLLAQLIKWKGKEFYAFTKPDDQKGQEFARSLGAKWAGGSDEQPPDLLDAAIIFAPVGSLIPEALKAVDKGGKVVCGGIHMSHIPSFPYSLLWEERQICSVANLQRKDGEDYMQLASQVPVRPTVHIYPLEKANQALDDLRNGMFDGGAVLKIE